MLKTSLYYAQVNGQVEASNKALIKLITRKIEESPWWWHEILFEALWAHRTAKHGVTKATPFELVYGQEAVLPVKINLQTYRVYHQDTLSTMDYIGLMMDVIDGIPEERLEALKEIEKEKVRVARAYNKKVRVKSFQVGELV
jgi:hypothetical protein